MITKIQQVSDLKLLMQALSDAKLIVANKEQKANYSIKLPQVQGDKITKITEIEASGDTLANVIDVAFNTLGSKYFVVYNGEVGDQGKEGSQGPQGDKGHARYTDISTSNKILVIANDDESEGEYTVWSAYRGKVLRDFLESLSEIIISDDTYNLLFRDEVFLELEFNTRADNQDITIVNYDNSDHKRYVKYWTFEDEGLEEEYFVKNGDEYVKLENFDVWTDFYLSDDLDECYTRELITTVINEETGETSSEYVYTLVNKPTWMYLEFETKTEDTTSNIINSRTELSGDDDDHYVPPIPEEEEIIISHISISSIEIDGSTSITIKSDINNIITKTISILPVNYINSPIGIEYDETMVKVFEDGRIMALDNPGTTTVKIYSVEDPSIYATINLNIVVLIKDIMFESNVINGYPSDTEVFHLNPIISPADASNQELIYTVLDNEYKEVEFDDVYVLDEETNNISLVDYTQKVYIKDGNDYIEVIVNNLTDDYQLIANDYVVYSKDDDILPPLYVKNTDVIATVDENGDLRLLKEGTVQVKVESTDGSGKSAIITINVLTRSNDIEIQGLYRDTFEIDEEMVELNNCYDILIDVGGRGRFMNTINATLLPEDTSNKELSWRFETPSQSNYLSVSDDTLSCTIRMTSYDKPVKLIVETVDGGVTKEIYLIGKVPVTNITLNSQLVTLDLGDRYILTANIEPNNADDKELSWSIANPLIADLVVSQDTHSCEVITKGGGATEIKVKATDGSGSEVTCTLESVILITDIILNNGNNMVVYGNGQTYEIPYEIVPNDAYNKTLEWHSTKEGNGIDIIGTVEGNKLRFRATSPCIGKIYAMSKDNGGVVASIDVEVLIASQELRLNENGDNDVDTYKIVASATEVVLSDYVLNLKVNDNYTLIAAVYPDNASLQVLNYQSLDENICDIDENGNITALSPGSTKILISTNDAEGNKLSAECIVNIN